MVFQIAAIVVLPIIMMIVAVSPFDEPINVQPSDPAPQENITGVYFAFFLLWIIWLLILTRIVYQVRRGRFRIKRGF